MRKTRLVILPGARCLNQLGFLLLFLACPTIAFKGQENRDVQPYCRLLTLQQNWLLNDTGERIGCEANDNMVFSHWRLKIGNAYFPIDTKEAKRFKINCQNETKEIEDLENFGRNHKSLDIVMQKMVIKSDQHAKKLALSKDNRFHSNEKRKVKSYDKRESLNENNLRKIRNEPLYLERNIPELTYERRNAAARASATCHRFSERKNGNNERSNRRNENARNFFRNILSTTSLQRYIEERKVRNIANLRSIERKSTNRKSSTQIPVLWRTSEERRLLAREEKLSVRIRRSTISEPTFIRSQQRFIDERRSLTRELFTLADQRTSEESRRMAKESNLVQLYRRTSEGKGITKDTTSTTQVQQRSSERREDKSLSRELTLTRSQQSLCENRRSLSREMELVHSRQHTVGRRSLIGARALTRRRVFEDGKSLTREAIVRSQRRISENRRSFSQEKDLVRSILNERGNRRSFREESALTRSHQLESENIRKLSKATTLRSSQQSYSQVRRVITGIVENTGLLQTSSEERISLFRTEATRSQPTVTERRSLKGEVEFIRVKFEDKRSSIRSTAARSRQKVPEDRRSLAREVEFTRLQRVTEDRSRSAATPSQLSVSEDRRSLVRELEFTRLQHVSEDRKSLTSRIAASRSQRSVSEDRKSLTRRFAINRSQQRISQDRRSLAEEVEFTRLQHISEDRKSLTSRIAASHSQRSVSEDRKSLTRRHTVIRPQSISEDRSLARSTVRLSQLSKTEDRRSLTNEELNHFSRSISEGSVLNRERALTRPQHSISERRSRLSAQSILKRSISDGRLNRETISDPLQRTRKSLDREVEQKALARTMRRTSDERMTEGKGNDAISQSRHISRSDEMILVSKIQSSRAVQRDSEDRNIVTRERSRLQHARFDDRRSLESKRLSSRTRESSFTAIKKAFRRSGRRLKDESIMSRGLKLIQGIVENIEKRVLDRETSLTRAQRTTSEKGILAREMPLIREIRRNVVGRTSATGETALKRSMQRLEHKNLAREALTRKIQRNFENVRATMQRSSERFEDRRNLSRGLLRTNAISVERRSATGESTLSQRRYEGTKKLIRNVLTTRAIQILSEVQRFPSRGLGLNRLQLIVSEERNNIAREVVSTRTIQRNSDRNVLTWESTISRLQRSISEEKRNHQFRDRIQYRELSLKRSLGRRVQESIRLEAGFLLSRTQRSLQNRITLREINSRRIIVQGSSLERMLVVRDNSNQRIKASPIFMHRLSKQRKYQSSVKFVINFRIDSSLLSTSLKNNKRSFSELHNGQQADNIQRMSVDFSSIHTVQPQASNRAASKTVRNSLNKFSREDSLVESPNRPVAMYTETERKQLTFNVKFNSKITYNEESDENLINSNSIFSQLLVKINQLGTSLFGGFEFVSKLLKSQNIIKFTEEYMISKNAGNEFTGIIQSDVKRPWNNQRLFTEDYYLPGAITGGILCANLYLNVNKREIY